jgi:hypothetical protein
MSDREKVIQAFASASDALNAGKVVELTGLDRKVVDKIMTQLKAEELIVSPKKCYWTLK